MFGQLRASFVGKWTYSSEAKAAVWNMEYKKQPDDGLDGHEGKLLEFIFMF